MFSNLEALRGRSPALQPRLSTGVRSLDVLLGGGLRLGRLCELSGESGAGRSSLALAIGLRCLALGQPVVWIESQPSLWPLPALEAGLPMEQLLRVVVSPPDRLRCLELLLTSPGAAVVAILDLAGAPPGREIASHQLVKLHRLAERSATLVLFLTERSAHAPALGLLIDVRLHLRQSGQPLPANPKDIFERPLNIQVLRHKQGPTQGSFSEVLHGPNRLRLRSTL